MNSTEKRKQDAEKARMRKAQAEIKKTLAKSPKLKCNFVNLESKGVDLDFTFMGEKFHLNDGQECVLPLLVVEHINSLKVPVKKYKTDPATGMLQPETEVVQMLQRFSVTPVNLAEYTESLKETKDGKKD